MNRWWQGLSVRAANVLQNHYSPHWHRKGVTPFDFSEATQEEVKKFLIDQITNKGVQIKRMRNAGVVAEKEILSWLGLSKKNMADKVREAAEASMNNERIDGGELYISGFEAGAAWALRYLRIRKEVL